MTDQNKQQEGNELDQQKHYATGIAFTSFNYKGHNVSVTARDGDRLQAEGSMLAIMDIIDEVIIPAKENPDNVDLNNVEGIHYDQVDNANPPATGDFPDIPEQQPEQNDQDVKNWGLVKYTPKASELSPYDRFDIEVDEYKFDGSKISFYKDGGKYPQINHNMSEGYPREKFDEVFKGWEPQQGDRTPMPGGSVILEITCSGPDSVTQAGNPYRNLEGMRRP